MDNKSDLLTRLGASKGKQSVSDALSFDYQLARIAMRYPSEDTLNSLQTLKNSLKLFLEPFFSNNDVTLLTGSELTKEKGRIQERLFSQANGWTINEEHCKGPQQKALEWLLGGSAPKARGGFKDVDSLQQFLQSQPNDYPPSETITKIETLVAAIAYRGGWATIIL